MAASISPVCLSMFECVHPNLLQLIPPEACFLGRMKPPPQISPSTPDVCLPPHAPIIAHLYLCR